MNCSAVFKAFYPRLFNISKYLQKKIMATTSVRSIYFYVFDLHCIIHHIQDTLYIQ